MSASFATLARLDDELRRHGFPGMSPWWRAEAERFYGTPGVRVWGAQVGRAGAKSTQIVEVALNEVLFGSWVVPPGERHYAVIVSENVTEASGRLRLLEAHLRALGIKYTRSGDVIDLEHAPLGFRVLACRVGAVSGFRAIFLACDEQAKWRSESSANPAGEIVASARAMTVTHPNARELHFSSPLGFDGFHATLIAKGDTDRQIVSRAPSWVANPSITEAQTRALEPDERVWRREYLAEPQAGALGAFDPAAIAYAKRDAPYGGMSVGDTVIAMDSSAGRGDAFCWIAAKWVLPFVADENDRYLWLAHDDPQADPRAPIVFHKGKGARMLLDATGLPVPNPEFARSHRPILAITNIAGIDGQFRGTLSSEEVVARVADTAREVGASEILGDQFQSFFLESEFDRRHGLRYRTQVWTNDTKTQSVLALRRLLRDRAIAIEPGVEGERLCNELLAFEERIAPSGALSFGARRGGHDDRTACLLNLMMREVVGRLDGSPHALTSTRFEIDGS